MKTYGSHATALPEGMYCEINFPVMIRLDERTPDGRLFTMDGFGVRELDEGRTLAIMVMRATGGGGHQGAEASGMVDEITLNDDKSVSGKGWMLDDENGHAGVRLVKTGVLRGNSVDIVADEYELTMDEDGNMLLDVTKYKLGATTICPVPAFENAYAEIADDVEMPAASEALLASIGSAQNSGTIELAFAQVKVKNEKPPADWFANPKLESPCPPIVSSDGLRTWGYVATWDQPHLSAGGGQLYAPHSQTDYAYFLNRHVLTDAGQVSTGSLVIGGDHAPDDMFWVQAIDYYAMTSRCWAWVNCGEDEIGIWFAGMVKPETAEVDIQTARASETSGDWRPIGRGLELVTSLSCNVGAFPKPRAAMRDSEQLSLIGAGAVRRSPQMGNLLALSAQDSAALRFVADRMARDEAAELVAGMDDDD